MSIHLFIPLPLQKKSAQYFLLGGRKSLTKTHTEMKKSLIFVVKLLQKTKNAKKHPHNLCPRAPGRMGIRSKGAPRRCTRSPIGLFAVTAQKSDTARVTVRDRAWPRVTGWGVQGSLGLCPSAGPFTPWHGRPPPHARSDLPAVVRWIYLWLNYGFKNNYAI